MSGDFPNSFLIILPNPCIRHDGKSINPSNESYCSHKLSLMQPLRIYFSKVADTFVFAFTI